MSPSKPSPYVPVSVGCQTSEIVVRGGYLKEPRVFTRLQCVNGKAFLMLWKSSRELVAFLSNEPAFKRPLSKTLVFETLASLRHEACRKLLAERAAPVQVEAAPGASTDDFALSLGLDSGSAAIMDEAGPALADVAEESGTKRRKRLRREREKLIRRQMPATVEVEYPRDGREPWRVLMLAAGGNVAPAIEATAANLQTLFELVDVQILGGDVRRSRFGAGCEEPKKGPHGPQAQRSYWISSLRRWVTKIPAENIEGKPYKRRFRTLTRRSSDETTTGTTGPDADCFDSLPPPKRRASSSRTAAPASSSPRKKAPQSRARARPSRGVRPARSEADDDNVF
jgi:hypothetical protein